MSTKLTRRHVLTALAGLGLGSAAFQRALAAQAEEAGQVTPEMIAEADRSRLLTIARRARRARKAPAVRGRPSTANGWMTPRST